MLLSEFDYELPPELIAQHPLPERSASRLLDARGPALADRAFRDLADLLRPEDLLVFNDTRVIKARLFGQKDSGGRVELLVERLLDEHRAVAQVRASHVPQIGGRIRVGSATFTVASREGGFLTFQSDEPLEPLLRREGALPLPPYISHPADAKDEERYQTVYARHAGAVAAPTAGLHFDETLLERLRGRGIATAYLTLHVGAGTFLPVRNENLDLHQMHAERFTIPEEVPTAIDEARRRGGRIVVVGTTTLRALESVAAATGQVEAGPGETRLFIKPGFRFRVADLLITNFHLPRSTLLVLVSAFAGSAWIKDAYAHAVAQRYRFFSYGDAMLLARADV